MDIDIILFVDLFFGREDICKIFEEIVFCKLYSNLFFLIKRFLLIENLILVIYKN